MKWAQLPIGEIFSLEKGSLQSSKASPGKYTFITAAEEWKTHKTYTHDCEALVYAVAASGSLGRAHYVKGQFVASDLCFIMREKDPDKYPVNFKFYQFLFGLMRKQIVSSTKSGTSKEAINQKNFSKYPIPYIDIDHQNEWQTKLSNLSDILQQQDSQFDEQNTYLIQLRQAILQEAIEGKLTAAWRGKRRDAINRVPTRDENNDAAVLLEKIKAEKAALIAEGKIKAATAQEAMFSQNLKIPKEWVMAPLGEITKQITDGTHQTPTYVNSGKIFLSAQNVKPFRFIPEKHQFVSAKAFEDYRKNRVPEMGDLLIGRVGAGIGETAVLDQQIEFAFYVSLGLVKVFKELTNPRYLAIVCNSPYGVAYAKGNVSSGGTSAGNYNLGRIRSFPIPLPPLAEQQAIVARVDKLLAMVDQLEQQVAERKVQAEELMQAVLREAFS